MRAPELRRARLGRTSETTAPLLVALAVVHAAREQLDQYATVTDAPAWQVVEAADLLDTAHERLAEAAKGLP